MPSALRLFSSALFQQIHLILGSKTLENRARGINNLPSRDDWGFWAAPEIVARDQFRGDRR